MRAPRVPARQRSARGWSGAARRRRGTRPAAVSALALEKVATGVDGIRVRVLGWAAASGGLDAPAEQAARRLQPSAAVPRSSPRLSHARTAAHGANFPVYARHRPRSRCARSTSSTASPTPPSTSSRSSCSPCEFECDALLFEEGEPRRTLAIIVIGRGGHREGQERAARAPRDARRRRGGGRRTAARRLDARHSARAIVQTHGATCSRASRCDDMLKETPTLYAALVGRAARAI